MKVAVVGATGLVGSVMLKVLAERNFPVTELIPVASAKSAGKEIDFKGKKYKVVTMDEAIAGRIISLATFLSMASERLSGCKYLKSATASSPFVFFKNIGPGSWMAPNAFSL